MYAQAPISANQIEAECQRIKKNQFENHSRGNKKLKPNIERI